MGTIFCTGSLKTSWVHQCFAKCFSLGAISASRSRSRTHTYLKNEDVDTFRPQKHKPSNATKCSRRKYGLQHSQIWLHYKCSVRYSIYGRTIAPVSMYICLHSILQGNTQTRSATSTSHADLTGYDALLRVGARNSCVCPRRCRLRNLP